MKWILGLIGGSGAVAAGVEAYGDYKMLKYVGSLLVQYPGYLIIFGVLISMVLSTRYIHKSDKYNFKFDYRSIATISVMVVCFFVLVLATLILLKQGLI